ncbi:25967_t:CDS:1, partial [Racocetra persica]
LAQDDDVIVGVELPKLYTWDFKTRQYKMILNKNGKITNNYKGGKSVHKLKEASVKTPKRRS